MIDPGLFSDLLAVSLQTLCIAALGVLLPFALRLDAARVRYTWFRVLLVACLVLPWVQGRTVPSAPSVTTTVAVVGSAAPDSSLPAGIDPTSPWMAALVVLIVSGIAARGVWILGGLWRLGRMRRAGQSARPEPMHEELQQLIGTRAEIRYVANLRQPVTFGIRRPLVLLPETLRGQSAHVQRAVLSHELLHVQRGDWMWLLAEEALRAVLWFHPGIWWLISRVQLTREEVVDELAVRATGGRRAYVEALAAFADESRLVPAAAFARRRHLFRRMTLIAREARMSSRRVVLSCAVMALVIGTGSWYAIRAFPLPPVAPQELLTEIGPLEKQAKSITPENPIPRRTFSVDPIYPSEAASANVSAMVALMITIDQYGRVAEIRSLGVTPLTARDASVDAPTMRAGLDALLRSSVDAVRQWRYDAPADAPLSIRVTFRFAPGQTPQLVSHDGWSVTRQPVYRLSGGRTGGPAATQGGPQFAPPPPPPPPAPGGAAASSPVGATGGFDPGTPAWATDGVRVSGKILPPTKTKHVNPVYPAIAQSAKVQGTVIFEIRISPEGKVTNARVLRSVPLLDQAALDAVMQWEFTPTLLNGQPVPILMNVTVQFTLT